MNRIKVSHLTPKAFGHAAKSLGRHLKPSVKKIGSSPGTLTYTGEETTATVIDLYQYDKQTFDFEQNVAPEGLPGKISVSKVSWISVTGFENLDVLEKIGIDFMIDVLTMEDLLNVSQLPKIEQREDYIYVTLKLVDVDRGENKFLFTHYSLVIKDDVVITFSERPNELFRAVAERLNNNQSKIRQSGQDYLSYRIVDTIVDHYYYSLDWFTDVLADLEIDLVEKPSKGHINTILTFKKQWLILRKTFYPLKEAFRRLATAEPKFIKMTGRYHIDDLNDHLQSIGETMEILRSTLENLMELYNSTVSNKLNEVMQVLTIVSTIFIPMTFIAGIYGMNFENMPELSWKNGYFYVLTLMLTIGLSMAVYMKRKRWF